jgi:hypothetical protein
MSVMSSGTKPSPQQSLSPLSDNNHQDGIDNSTNKADLASKRASRKVLVESNINSVLRSGDAVLIQSATSGRYLTVHRGWWVSWTSEDAGSKSLFTVSMLSSTGRGYLPNGTRLIAGAPFRLRSVRWSEWEVRQAHQMPYNTIQYNTIPTSHLPIDASSLYHSSLFSRLILGWLLRYQSSHSSRATSCAVSF